MRRALIILTLVSPLGACKKAGDNKPPAPAPKTPSKPTPTATAAAPSRLDFNRFAARANLPYFWVEDTNKDGKPEADEIAGLRFYPTEPAWTDALVAQITAAGQEKPADHREELMMKELDAGRPTLVRNDFASASADDKAFVGHMLKIADLIDALYLKQTGAAAVVDKVAKDAASQSVFRRNFGPQCVAPATENDPDCSAIPGEHGHVVGVYPADMQASKTFCEDLQKRKDAKDLTTPFAVVEGTGDALEAVPYNEAYKDDVTAIAAELEAAAGSVTDPNEAPLVAYLKAAAASFRSNDWVPSDEAWAKMNAENSKWYVRVAPDEVYWEPCALKAGFHLTFARINDGSLEWQKKLVPVQQDMEAAVAERAGAPYTARKVSFHLPDFIDIIVNAGDDRHPLGATIGQSLPNVGKVADEGRGRTVAMSNLWVDPDSEDARFGSAQTVLDTASLAPYAKTPTPGLLSTILHEATHNLGPHADYAVDGKPDTEIFGGPMASVLEELKAQTGGLFLIDFLKQKGIIDDQLAQQTYIDSIVWAFGHISEGMYTGAHERKAYSQLAAIQIGFLMDQGALTWDPNAAAANGTDKGAFTVHYDKLAAACDEMMKVVAGIKARGDTKAADELVAKYVDGDVVPQKIIAERFLRQAKGSLVYSVSL